MASLSTGAVLAPDVEEAEGKQQSIMSVAAAANEHDSRKIRTKRATCEVAGEQMEVIVQDFGNIFVVIASSLPVPGVVFKCEETKRIDRCAGLYEVTPLLGTQHDIALSVIGRQLIERISKVSAKPLLLYLGIRPANLEENSRQIITETIQAVESCRMW
ncbi:hypothetical protein DIPPA_09098 [Diplonema papillatum]|nr:hypothetical protein DIPPA_09098 [Diplonema papillatum]KAJ9453115.1 hypothetical protein DIPPA_09098 [Diplonema papillatum]